MKDPILDEIQRVRAQLLNEHGGIDGYLKFMQGVERARLRRERAAAAKPKPTKKAKTAR